MSKKQTTTLVREEELLPLLSPEGMTPAVYSMLLAGILAWAKQKAKIISNLEKEGAKYADDILTFKQTFKKYAAWVWTLNAFAQAKAQSLRAGHKEDWYLLALDTFTTLYSLERYKRRFAIKEGTNGPVQKRK